MQRANVFHRQINPLRQLVEVQPKYLFCSHIIELLVVNRLAVTPESSDYDKRQSERINQPNDEQKKKVLNEICKI